MFAVLIYKQNVILQNNKVDVWFQEDLMINLVIEQMINDTDPGERQLPLTYPSRLPSAAALCHFSSPAALPWVTLCTQLPCHSGH